MRAQNFEDFEVIVCDNHTKMSARDVFDRVADERLRYLRSLSPLSMIDNWEYAIQHATGKYVSIPIDKVSLRLPVLQVMYVVCRLCTVFLDSLTLSLVASRGPYK